MASFDVFQSEKVTPCSGARFSLALQKAFSDGAPKTIGAPRRTSVELSESFKPVVARFSTSEDELGLCDALARKLERVSLMNNKIMPLEEELPRTSRRHSKSRKFQKMWVGTFCKAKNARGFSPCMIPDMSGTLSRPSSRRGSGVNRVAKGATANASTFASLVAFSTIDVESTPRHRRSWNSAKSGSICVENSPRSCWSVPEMDNSPKGRRSLNGSRNGSICFEEASPQSARSVASSVSSCRLVGNNECADSQACVGSPRIGTAMSEGDSRKQKKRYNASGFDSLFHDADTPSMIESPTPVESKGFLPSFRIKQSRQEWSTSSTSTFSASLSRYLGARSV